jgi:hypothetical protein
MDDNTSALENVLEMKARASKSIEMEYQFLISIVPDDLFSQTRQSG